MKKGKGIEALIPPHGRATEIGEVQLNTAYAQLNYMITETTVVYFVPNAGYKVMEELGKRFGRRFKITTDPTAADMIIDDIIDSGATLERYRAEILDGILFYALVSKNKKYDAYGLIKAAAETWVVLFPGEQSGVKENIKRILQFIGEDPEREGLLDTPSRVEKSYKKLYGGYKESAGDVLKTTFVEGACDEMVLLKDIEFYSMCEHHMLPFSGKIHIAYVPDKKVVGISKLARLVEVFARRLQIQERLVTQIADAMTKHLQCKGVMVVCEAQHLCMTARGVEKQNSKMITSAVRGVFTTQETRSEFLSLINK